MQIKRLWGHLDTNVKQILNYKITHLWIKALKLDIASTVTRLGDLMDFGQLFKAFGDN